MGSSGGGSLAPSPFRLPATYEEAKERKVAAVSDLRNAVKAVWLDFRSPLHLVKTSRHVLSGLAHGGASKPARIVLLHCSMTALSALHLAETLEIPCVHTCEACPFSGAIPLVLRASQVSAKI